MYIFFNKNRIQLFIDDDVEQSSSPGGTVKLESENIKGLCDCFIDCDDLNEYFRFQVLENLFHRNSGQSNWQD